MPYSVSINDFFGNRGTVVYGQLAAFSIIYSTPVILLYVLVARRFGGGFALGARSRADRAEPRAAPSRPALIDGPPGLPLSRSAPAS